MSNEKDYAQLLDKIDAKLENYNNKEQLDLTELKELVSQIDLRMTDNQAKQNFDAIKEKLEKMSSQLEGAGFDALEELKHDIETLVDNSDNITNSLEKIQNLQNLTMTSAEFEEFQRQQLDLALKSNDDIFSRLTEIQENTKAFKRIDGIEKIGEELERINDKLVARVQEILHDFKVDSSKLPKPTAVPLGTEGGVAGGATLPAETLEIQYKSIRQTHKYVKELKESIETLKNKDLSAQLAKIDEIYENMLTVETWTKEMNLLNSTFENMVSKLSRSINLDEMTKKLDSLTDDISGLTDQSDKIDYIAKQLDKIQKKTMDGALSDESAEKISSLIARVKEGAGLSLADMPEFDDLCSKVDIVYESLSALNIWASKLDTIQEKIENIKSVDRPVSDSGEPTVYGGGVDVDDLKKSTSDVNSKVDTIIENVNILNDRLSEIDIGEQLRNKVDNKLEEVNAEISQKIEEISRNIDNFNEEINNINLVAKVSEELDDNLSNVNIEIAKKVENISSTINRLNEEISKLDIKKALKDDINDKFENLNNQIAVRINDVFDTVRKYNDEMKSTDVVGQIISEINESLTQMADGNNSAETNERLAEISNDLALRFEELQSYLPSDNTEMLSQIKEHMETSSEDIQGDLTQIREQIETLNSGMQTDLTQIREQIETTNADMQSDLAQIKEQLETVGMQTDLTQIKEQIENSNFDMQNDLTQIKEQLETANTDIQGNIVQIRDQIETISSDMQESLAIVSNDIKPELSVIGDNLTNNLNERIADLNLELASKLDEIQNIIPSDTKEITEQLKDELTEKLNFIYDEINDKIVAFTNEYKPELDNVVEGITNNISSKLADLAAERSNSVENILFTMDEIKDSTQKFEYVVQVAEALNERMEEIANLANSNVETINNSFHEISELLSDNFAQNSDDISRQFTQVSATIEELSSNTQIAGETLRSLQDEIKSMYSDMESIAEKYENSDAAFREFKEALQKTVAEELSKINDSFGFVEDKLEENSNEIINKVNDVSQDINMLKDKAEDNSETLRNLSDDIKSKMDEINRQNAESSNDLRYLMNELDNSSIDMSYVKSQLDNSNTYIDYLKNKVDNSSDNLDNVKEQLDGLSKEFVNLTGTKDLNANNYVYTLFDVESDFIKIHKIINDNTKYTDDNIQNIKDDIDSINSDISSISKRTNKLIVNSDDMNKKFRAQLNDLADAITQLHDMRYAIESTMKVTGLESKVNSLTEASDNLSNAFSYLAQWIDSVGESLKIVKSSVENYSEDTKSQVGIYYSDIINKLADLRADSETQGLYLQNEIMSKNEQFHGEVLEKLAELKAKHNSELDLLLNNDDYYKDFTDQFEVIIKKIKEIEEKNSENFKMLLNSEKVYVKLFDKLEYLDDRMFLNKIIKKIENFEDKTVLIKLLKKIEKISKTNSQKVMKQVEGLEIPDSDSISVKTLEMLSPIFEELLKSVQKHGKTNNDMLKGLSEDTVKRIDEIVKLAQTQEKKIADQSKILDKYNARLIEQAKIMDNYNAKLTEQSNIIIEQKEKIMGLEDKISELEDKFENISRNNSTDIKNMIEALGARLNVMAEVQAAGRKESNDKVDALTSKLKSFDGNITKIVNYIEE